RFAIVALEMQLAVRREAEEALEIEVLAALDAEHRHPAVDRVAEIDRPVGAQHDVVGAVELLALPVGGQHAAVAGRGLHDQLAGGMLADIEVAAGVIGHAVALVARIAHLDDAAGLAPAAADVARHVAEIEALLAGVPDRAFGELEPGAEALDD